MHNKFKIQHKRPRKITTEKHKLQIVYEMINDDNKLFVKTIKDIVICYSINPKSTGYRRVSLDTALPAERYCKFVIGCDWIGFGLSHILLTQSERLLAGLFFRASDSRTFLSTLLQVSPLRCTFGLSPHFHSLL